MATKKEKELALRDKNRKFIQKQGMTVYKDTKKMNAKEKAAYNKLAKKKGLKMALDIATSGGVVGAGVKMAGKLAGKVAAKKFGGKLGAGVSKKVKKFVGETAPSRKGPKGKTSLSPKTNNIEKNKLKRKWEKAKTEIAKKRKDKIGKGKAEYPSEFKRKPQPGDFAKTKPKSKTDAYMTKSKPKSKTSTKAYMDYMTKQVKKHAPKKKK